MLGQLNEKKSLIYFASGLRLNGVDNQAQLHATINAAIQAGVVVLARSMRAASWRRRHSAMRRRARRAESAMFTGAAAQRRHDQFQRSQDTLYCAGGGHRRQGAARLPTICRSESCRRSESMSSYYIIGYYTTNPAQDGQFRRVKITLNSRAVDAKLDYRQGYLRRQGIRASSRPSTRSGSSKMR